MKTFKSLSLSLFLLAGCSDFVETPDPQGKTVFTSFYVSENQVFQGLVAAYDPISYTLIAGYCSTVMLGEIRSDNANAGGDPTNFDQPGWQEIDDMKATPLTIEAESFWQKNYIGLNKANQVLNNVTIQSPVIDQYQAEAKFLRALYHFELVRMFGPMPVITKALDPSDRNIKRATLSQVYGQIEKDLLEAIPLLPTSYSESFAGRATKGAAQALLGKAYLYWADLLNDDKSLFDKAAEQLNIVITSNQYELVDDYKSLFAFGAANTVESVFEIQYTNQVGADFNTYYPFVNGNRIVQLCGIRGLCSTHPTYIDGWGFMLPTQNLYNSYLPDDTYRRDAAIISRTALQAGGCNVAQNDQNPTDLEGYWQIKYANYKNYSAPNGGEVKVLKDANQPYIRYADVLLMYAEALVRGNGSAAEALTYIDQVRERAAGPGDNTGSFKTSATLMTEKGWNTLDLIWYERRAEFAIEGDRWFDLVRSGRATAELFEAGNLRNTNFSDEDLYLPIPQREVDITGGLLTVYPDDSLFQ